jgi:hypothetical protein
LNKRDWVYGFPYRNESWPGMRALPALEPSELEPIEAWVRQVTGASRLWQEPAPAGDTLNHNCVQIVGARESEQRPHTDSKRACTYAGVLYLSPVAPEHCGTSFFRQRLENGELGGNYVPEPHATLVEALGTRFVPAGTFIEDVRIPYRHNGLLVYRANLVHSATAYCGTELLEKRMTCVFFWMAGTALT